MPLTELWKTAHKEIQDKHIQQVIGFAGDGNHKQSFVALGCGSVDTILLIPGNIFIKWLDRFHKTELKDRFYWHIRIHKDKEGYLLRVKKGAETVRLNEYLLKS